MLTFLIISPLLGALAIAFAPKDNRDLIRNIAAAATGLSLLLALAVFLRFDPAADGFQFIQKTSWVETLGISYHVGVDGVNVGIVLMAAIVSFAAVFLCGDIQTRIKEFHILLLIMTAGVLGAFASLDLFFFYFFHELALVPTFIMIGVWGRGEQKKYAAYKITIYLSIGALLALIGLIGVYAALGANTFDIVELTALAQTDPISSSAQNALFPLLLFGFGILVSLWPFHTWAPLGYGAAPTATAMIHAGVLKKFGLYGLIRVAMPLLPHGAQNWMNLLALLCLGNILYCGLVTIRQRDLNQLIGNSSVAHMGFIFLGLASLTLIGVTGAVVVIIAHGLLAALSFGLSGHLYQQNKTLEMTTFGGLLKRAPFLGGALTMALLAGCGLPGFANFAGEALVFFGAWKPYPIITLLACWGALVIGAVYMLRAIRVLLHADPGPTTQQTQDAVALTKLPFALLLAALITFGLFPRLLTEKIKPAAEKIVIQTTAPATNTPNLATTEGYGVRRLRAALDPVRRTSIKKTPELLNQPAPLPPPLYAVSQTPPSRPHSNDPGATPAPRPSKAVVSHRTP